MRLNCSIIAVSSCNYGFTSGWRTEKRSDNQRQSQTTCNCAEKKLKMFLYMNLIVAMRVSVC